MLASPCDRKASLNCLFPESDSTVYRLLHQHRQCSLQSLNGERASVSDMRFTAEFEIRSTRGWDEARTFLVRRYFGAARSNH